jgi:hypothetical protein
MRRGYKLPIDRAGQKERAEAAARQEREREDTPLPSAKEQPKDDTRSVAERIGLGAGLDLDAELDRRRLAMIASPDSTVFAASTKYAEMCGERHGWSDNTKYQYALALRSIDLPRPRQTTVALVDREQRERFHVPVTTNPAGVPDGWALFLPANVDPWLILGLTPPSLQPAPTLLSLSPSHVLTAQQRAEAACRMQSACDELERTGFLQWQDRGSRGLLRL